MEDLRKKNDFDSNEKEIIHSKSVKAGKRIYYLDVKKNRRGELFLAITESKKVVSGDGESLKTSFEKHKIFLYKEDFEKFLNGLQDTITYINENQKPGLSIRRDGTAKEDENYEMACVENNNEEVLNEEIKIDIDFE